MDLKDWIAAYAAVVSTATAAWNIYCAGWRDTARLKVSPNLGWLVRDITGQLRLSTFRQHRSGRLCLSLSVVNVGRRPITITEFRGSYADGKKFTVPQPAPRELKEYERTDLVAEDAAALMERRAAKMFVIDAAERRWNVGRADMRHLRRKYEHLKVEMAEPATTTSNQ